MKNLLWIIVAAVVLLGGYMLFTGKSVDDVMQGVGDKAEQTGAPAAVEDATKAAGEAAEKAKEAATEAAEKAKEAATEAAEKAKEAASEAVDAAKNAAESATDAAKKAVTDTTTAPATTATGTAATTPAQSGVPAELTADGFDLAKARSFIEGSSLGDTQKAYLIQGLEAAQNNPETLSTALDAAKKALGF